MFFSLAVRSAQRLTASKELEQLVAAWAIVDPDLCSTPYGIKGIGTWKNAVFDSLNENVCSTPYGIKGIGTFPSLSPRVCASFLCSTPYGIKGIGTLKLSVWCLKPRSAQRLTASKELERVTPGRELHRVTCAQRLTASKELEQHRPHLLLSNRRVLNALRHQRNWNLSPGNSWGSHFLMCSTPYGIKGIGTWQPMSLSEIPY